MMGISTHIRFPRMNSISKLQLTLCAGALVATFLVSGCSESPETGKPEAAAPAASPTPTVVGGMTEPLAQDLVGAQYRIAAEPLLVQNGELIRTVVSVTNSGKVAINSRGKLPVNLAISLVDGSGSMISRDFVRASLPDEGIPAGGSADVVTEVQAKYVVDKGLRFGLVQEGVAWFSDLNVATLDSGILSACEDQGKRTICGKEGKPLATAPEQ